VFSVHNLVVNGKHFIYLTSKELFIKKHYSLLSIYPERSQRTHYSLLINETTTYVLRTKKDMKTLIIGISIVIAAGIIAGVIVMQSDKYLTQKIWRDCAEMYQVEYTQPDGQTKVISPNEDQVKECVKANTK